MASGCLAHADDMALWIDDIRVGAGFCIGEVQSLSNQQLIEEPRLARIRTCRLRQHPLSHQFGAQFLEGRYKNTQISWFVLEAE